MQNHDWIEVFRLIPVNQHNVLVLTTLSGVDLSIETIMRTELDYLVFRGRVCGSTDDGRVFFLPYRQIDYLQINRSMKEAEIKELFGETDGPKSGFLSAPGSGVPRSGYGPPGSVVTAGSGSGVGRAILPPHPAATTAGGPANVPAAALQPPPAPTASNIPPAALIPPPPAPGGAPQRNSILERLRAQRNAVLPPRPPDR